MVRSILVIALSGLFFLCAQPSAVALTIENGGAAGLAAHSGRSGAVVRGSERSEATTLDDRLRASGLKLGAPVFLRIFKAESQLEVWLERDERYVLFETYRICRWAGGLGPKLAEGDRQSPEGLYVVSRRQVGASRRWNKIINIGFPNNLDEGLGRTGSYILLHGGCDSVGCFAMTDQNMDEIYRIASAAFSKKSVTQIPIHIYPFRMTDSNMAKHTTSRWHPFWRNLKTVYDQFESSYRPSRVLVCNDRYVPLRSPVDLGASRHGDETCEPLRASRGQIAMRGSTAETSTGSGLRTARWQPWGVHVTADFSPAKALRFYAEIRARFSAVLGNRRPLIVRKVNYSFGTRPRHNVVLGEPTRAKAEKLCARLRKAGGLCLVVRN